jgi:NADPH2:quinone reductase
MGFSQTVSGYYVGHWFRDRPEECRNAFETLVQFVKDGSLRVEISERFPLDQASDAHRAIESRRVTGKVILKPWA